MEYILRLPRKPALLLIRLYQKTISPDHGFFKVFFPGGYCKFNPSCSAYTYQAIAKYGVIKGAAKGIYRILRCNPFTLGGDDELR